MKWCVGQMRTLAVLAAMAAILCTGCSTGSDAAVETPAGIAETIPEAYTLEAMEELDATSEDTESVSMMTT